MYIYNRPTTQLCQWIFNKWDNDIETVLPNFSVKTCTWRLSPQAFVSLTNTNASCKINNKPAGLKINWFYLNIYQRLTAAAVVRILMLKINTKSNIWSHFCQYKLFTGTKIPKYEYERSISVNLSFYDFNYSLYILNQWTICYILIMESIVTLGIIW